MFDTGNGEDIFGMPVTREVVRASEAPRRAAAGLLLSRPLQHLLAAVQIVVEQTPVELPGPQALADTAALLSAVEQLRGALLTRVADVDARHLHALDGAASTGTWIAAQQTSMDRGEVALARRMSALPRLEAAVRDGTLSVAAASQVGKALTRLRRHVDRPDGLIDGQPAEQVLVGVIGHGVKDLVCQALAGLDDDDPRLVLLLQDLASIVESPTSELARLEAAFVLLAVHLEPGLLPSALGALVDACLPNELEKRAADAHANRGFGVRLNSDGSGWHVFDGELDLETGELLHAALEAAMATDPDNSADTDGYGQLRADGWQAGDGIAGAAVGCTGPRSLRQRRHDALSLVLRRLLDSGALGSRDKVAPHLAVMVGLDSLDALPGSLPAVAASGTRLPASLVRRWLCDGAVTRFVLSLGRRVVETSHTERTLKPHERRAKRLETGGVCQGAGCARGPGSPGGGQLVPHHPVAFAACGTTSFRDTVLLCDQTHADIHGGRTIRLKDGRWLNERGWTQGPG